ncbi:Serine carboxypeptidase-like 48 [Glycine soja]
MKEILTLASKPCYPETSQSCVVVVSPLFCHVAPPLSCSCVIVNVEGVNTDSRFRLSHTATSKFFFESRSSKNDHVVIWLTREPGCNNELTLFYENGHFKLTKNFFLVWNDYGWDKASNLIFVYQPIIGTRFTYTYNESDIRHDEEGVSSDLYDSLQSLQQDNLFDYGLFLLHSIELFLDEAPFNFNPFKLTKLSNFDDIVLNEELMHIMANPNFQQVAQVSPQSFSLTYITRGCETKICHDQETLYNQSTTRLSHF